MSRKKGAPAYPGKSIIGSTYMTKGTRKELRATAKKTKRSASDIIEHALRVVLPDLTVDTPLVGLPGTFGPKSK